MASPYYAAERVLDQLGIADPEDLQLLDAIAWERGAMVLYKPLRAAEGRLVVLGGKAVITVSSAGNLCRRRFSVAHELGHLEMHQRQGSMFLCSSQDMNDWEVRPTAPNLEREANQFASMLLLPERFFAQSCCDDAPSLDGISQLAETFNVSLTATAIRYLDFCDEACAIVLSQGGYIRWFQSSREFDRLSEDTSIFVDVRSKLDPSSLAVGFFQGRAVQPDPKRVRASAWFRTGHYRTDAVIVEQSWTMPQYDAVLSLLWVDDDIEDEDDGWLDYS
jgi:hypothetical protein